jgi:hypothetical protein
MGGYEMFYKCIKDAKGIVKGKIYEGARIDSIGSTLAGYYLYCIGVIGKDFLQEVDYKDVIVVKNSPYLTLGSKYEGIKIHDPITDVDVWKINGFNDEEFAEDILVYCEKEVKVDDRALFIDMINNIKNGERYTCGDCHVEKIGETYKFISSDGAEIDVSALTRWRREETDTVDFIDAYKHLEDGGSVVSVLSGVRYSFEDIDKNDYQEIDIDEIKNKWMLV